MNEFSRRRLWLKEAKAKRAKMAGKLKALKGTTAHLTRAECVTEIRAFLKDGGCMHLKNATCAWDGPEYPLADLQDMVVDVRFVLAI